MFYLCAFFFFFKRYRFAHFLKTEWHCILERIRCFKILLFEMLLYEERCLLVHEIPELDFHVEFDQLFLYLCIKVFMILHNFVSKYFQIFQFIVCELEVYVRDHTADFHQVLIFFLYRCFLAITYSSRWLFEISFAEFDLQFRWLKQRISSLCIFLTNLIVLDLF